jgi:hypothetical protein
MVPLPFEVDQIVFLAAIHVINALLHHELVTVYQLMFVFR